MLFRIFTVLAVIALAVSTWILSSPGPRARRKPARNRRTAAGYYLKNAVLTDYDAAGAPRIRIQAERIDQIGSRQRGRADQRAGRLSGAERSELGHVRRHGARAAGRQGRRRRGNVRLQGVEPEHPGTAVIRTDALSYDVPASVATTKSDVRIEFERHTLDRARPESPI